MPQGVSYWIEDRSDGLFDVVARLDSGKIFRRTGCASRTEVDLWIEDLRVLMAAIGAPVSPTMGGSHETPGSLPAAAVSADEADF
jgi:hypothetical protein